TIASSSDTVSVNAIGNTTQLITLEGLRPDANGEIAISVLSNSGGQAHINALVLEASLTSLEVPAAPRDLTAVFYTSTNKIKLNWVDAAFDETGYELFRSDESNSYTLIQQLAANTTEFFDADFLGNSHISYKVRAINEIGQSLFSDSVSIITPNKIPTLLPLESQEIIVGNSIELNVEANDDEGDVLTITGINLPSFVSLSSISNRLSKL